MEYFVIYHSYKDNTTTYLETFLNKGNAHFFVEEFISEYIEKHQGEKECRMTFVPPELGSSFKEGFFGVVYKDFVDKITIYNRIRYIGWIMNTQVDEKHFDIFIAEKYRPKFSKDYVEKTMKERPAYCEKARDDFNLCLDELENAYSDVNI